MEITVSFQNKPISYKYPNDKAATQAEKQYWYDCKKYEHRKDTTIDTKQLALEICNGQAWNCGTFKKRTTTSNKNLEQIQAIAFDIDNDNKDFDQVSYLDIKKRLNNWGIVPTFSYYSFSHSELKEKFRIVFILAETIKTDNIRKWGILANMLYKLIPEADKASLIISQLWLGTNKPPIEINERIVLNEQNLYDAFIEESLKDIDEAHRARYLTELAEKLGLHQSPTGLPLCVFTEDATTIKPQFINDLIAQELLTFTESGKTRKPTVSKEKPQRLDLPQSGKTNIKNWKKKAREVSPSFFSKWEIGEWILKRDLRLYLISNLDSIEGGLKHYLEIMREHTHKGIYEHDFDYYENEARRYTMRLFPPQRCPDELIELGELASQFTNLKTAILNSDTKPYLIQPLTRIDTEEGNIMMQDDLFNAATDKDKAIGIYGFNMDTGGGKTEIYINYIAENYNTIGRTIIALPTHALKSEVVKRFKDKGIDVCELLERPIINDEEKRKEYNRAMKVGFYNVGYKIWEDYFKSLKVSEEYMYYNKYNARLKESHSAKVIVMTHDFSLLSKLKHNNVEMVIYDEDIFKKVVNIETTTLQDVKDFCNSYNDKARLQPMLDALDNALQDRKAQQKGDKYQKEYYNVETPNWNIDINIRDYKGSLPKTNIIELFHAKGFCINYNEEIQYVYTKPIGFYGAKVMVMSATLNNMVYSKLTEGRACGFYQIPHLENKGTIIQDLSHTYSKTYFDKNFKQAIEDIKQLVPDYKERVLITFKAYAEAFENADFKLHKLPNGKVMAFGSTEGIDELKGQKLLIAGKYNLPNFVYKLWGKALNINLEPTAFNQYSQRIEHNGYSFNIMTFEQEEMRELHLYLMESEILQAVGRARTVREETANVVVLCDLPLFNSDTVNYKGEEVNKVN